MVGTITGSTRVTAVFGYPVRHSRSPEMHNAAFRELGIDWVYVPFEVHPTDLKAAISGIRALGLAGVNLTIPHKEHAVKLLDWVSEDALRIGSVNTIHNVDGVLKGYSTDGEGFLRALKANERSPAGSRAVVFGAGGSARAIVYSLAAAGARVTVVNRTYDRAVGLSDSINSIVGIEAVECAEAGSEEARIAVSHADLIVNCTSVGLHPGDDVSPVPREWLHERLLVFDLVYDPLETRLIRDSRSTGADVVGGIDMLVFQGALSFSIWTGVDPSIDVMKRAILADVESMCHDTL